MSGFASVAVLNRGEAAVRFMRAARTWSRMRGKPLDPIAFFTDPDEGAMFVRMASRTVDMGAPMVVAADGGTRSAYLDVDRVVALCLEAGAEALWPGWGFLAESPELADACAAAGITFIGPSGDAMRLLGDKMAAKLLADEHGVPVSAWSKTLVADVDEARLHAEKIGFPVLLKATAGGGGRGIRVVREPGDLEDAFVSASNEALAAFGNAGLLVEQFVPTARHVEVQVLADTHGTVWALGTRDCSMQRRHQKVMEEAPAPDLSDELRDRLCEAAVAVAKASSYVGAGTAEFLVEPDGTAFYFLEMNTRLQVEHTVTECCYGVDLVVSQIDIAAGLPLPADGPPAPRGHAVEVRLNAEDPDDGFSPSVGFVSRFEVPQGPGIRVDSGLGAGGVVPAEFDSMIAKIIGWGADRAEAYARLETALRDCVVAIDGGPTNRSLLLELLAQDSVRAGVVTTRWLDGYLQGRKPFSERPHLGIALAAAAIGDHLRARRGLTLNFLTAAQRGLPRSVPDAEPTHLRYLIGRTPVALTVATMGPSCYRITSGDGRIELQARSTGPRTMTLRERAGDSAHTVLRIATPVAVHVQVDGVAHRFTRTSDGRVLSGMPAAVTRVHVQPGERVEAGERLVTLEVMKMETAVDAPLSGVITAVHVDAASRVAAGDLLVVIQGETAGEDAGAEEAPRVLPGVEAIRPEGAVRLLRLSVLGYDTLDDDIDQAIRDLRSGAAGAGRAALLELLQAVVLQLGLFQSGPYDDAINDSGDSSAEQLAAFLKHMDVETDDPSETFKTRLTAFLALHDIGDLKRTFELECALLRLVQAHGSPKRIDRIVFAVVAALAESSDEPASPGVEAYQRDVLEDLANLVIERNRQLAQALWHAIYLLSDLPRHRLAARRIGAEALTALTRLVDPESTSGQRSEAGESLRNVPLGTLLGLVRQSAGEPRHWRRSVLELLLRRIYDVEQVSDLALGSGICASELRTARGERVVGLCVTTEEELLPIIGKLPADVSVDLALGFEPDPERLPTVVEGLRCKRVSLLWGSGETGLRCRTYRVEGAVAREIELHRDLHPARLASLEVTRLKDFELTRLPAPGGIFLAVARAADGSGDERLFAIGEVERFDVEPEPGGRGVRLPSFEKTFLDGVHGLRQAIRLRGGRDKLVWNRLTLFVRPVIQLRRSEIESIAERLGPPTTGLSLEKVVIRARIAHPDHPERPPADTIVEWSNPTGRGPVLSFALPRHRPVRVLSDYERRVVEATRRGKFYPYELIRTLTSDRSTAGFADGEFEELDLDDRGHLVSVYKRPYGQNTANLVVGRITNLVGRFREDGLTRILIIGDPTRTMGSLGEAESRRVIAAIDLAEQRGLPVEWVPISSGARISFDSGTENLDWTAAVLKRIITFTQKGGVINIIVDGTCVGAQSYWNAEATMLMHCRGALVMTPSGCMLLTGKRALEYSGSVSAPTNEGIGGLDAIMGPNGQAQYMAPNLREAYALLFRHYELTYVPPEDGYTRSTSTSDPVDRDVTRAAYRGAEGFATIGEIFSDETNPGRKRPFAIREVMRAVVDQDVEPLERWKLLTGGETAVIQHAQLGGRPVTVIGIESMPLRRRGEIPPDGPEGWASGTLFPESSRKVARAINAGSGVAPVVVLANLSGFDGSPESLRRRQLEFGAEIGRAVVNFDGPLIFCVIARYHGGSYVVFSQVLNDGLEAMALEGTYASVIGGGPAAAVVFPGLVRRRMRADARLQEARKVLDAAPPKERPAARARYEGVARAVEAEVQSQVAREFDEVHSVQRAQKVGSLRSILTPAELRPYLVGRVEAGLAAWRKRAS